MQQYPLKTESTALAATVLGKTMIRPDQWMCMCYIQVMFNSYPDKIILMLS